jgi:hypothetical protein
MTMHGLNEIERLRFWQGQRLRSRDFRDQAVYEAMLRWWHNRALHIAYGVRYGFEVSLEEDDGVIAAVEVGCGLAYDCFGRELILQAPQRVRLPDFAEPPARLTLLARYKESGEFLSKGEVPAGCANPAETPVFSWKTSQRIEAEDGVPIARLTYETADESERLPALDDTFRAPRVRALSRPRINSGNTAPGHTAWELWSERVSSMGGNAVNRALGVQVTIDTSAAGFTETPCYFAWLQGSLWDQPYIEFFPAPLAHIDEGTASARQFRFRLWMPFILGILGSRARIANQGFATEFLNFAQAKKLHVCWLGIQHKEEIGCEPVKEYGCRTVSED